MELLNALVINTGQTQARFLSVCIPQALCCDWAHHSTRIELPVYGPMHETVSTLKLFPHNLRRKNIFGKKGWRSFVRDNQLSPERWEISSTIMWIHVKNFSWLFLALFPKQNIILDCECIFCYTFHLYFKRTEENCDSKKGNAANWSIEFIRAHVDLPMSPVGIFLQKSEKANVSFGFLLVLWARDSIPALVDSMRRWDGPVHKGARIWMWRRRLFDWWHSSLTSWPPWLGRDLERLKVSLIFPDCCYCNPTTMVSFFLFLLL